MHHQRHPLQKLLGYILLLTSFIVVLGSWVRATSSGLACPDWPLCHGEFVPEFTFQIFMEWFHRLVAGSLGVLFVILLLKVWRHPEYRRQFGPGFAAAFILLAIQIVLGGLTVLHLLNPKVVSLHLINAMAFMAILCWLYTKARSLRSDGRSVRSILQVSGWKLTYKHSRIKVFLLALAVLVFCQLALGGAVSSHHAGLACLDFPTCQGSWFPPPIPHYWLQMSHRYVAFLLLLLAFGLKMYSHKVSLPLLALNAIRILPSLILLQIGLGVINIFYTLPTWASVSHLGNGVLIFVSLALGFFELKFFLNGDSVLAPIGSSASFGEDSFKKEPASSKV